MKPTVYIYERKDDIDLDQYQKMFSIEEIDKNNCVVITIYNDKGDFNLLKIPTKDFSEFVRQCQKMKATLS